MFWLTHISTWDIKVLTKMQPLHLKHLLGSKLCCLAVRALRSTARTARHQLTHQLSCTSHTLTVLPEPLIPATNSHTLAASAQQLEHRGQEVSKSTERSDCARRGAQGSPCRPSVVWLQIWPRPTTATKLALAKLQRCIVSLHTSTHTQLRTHAMQKTPVGG